MCVKTDYKFLTVWEKFSENRRGFDSHCRHYYNQE